MGHISAVSNSIGIAYAVRLGILALNGTQHLLKVGVVAPLFIALLLRIRLGRKATRTGRGCSDVGEWRTRGRSLGGHGRDAAKH